MSDYFGLERYRRQIVLSFIGEQRQRKLASVRAVVIGCGALGTAIANHLVRLGVGLVRLVDDDRVALDNLHRQTLFREDDAQEKRFKVIAARDVLLEANREVSIEAVPDRLTGQTIERICGDIDLVFDGNDNHATRFLINSFCVERCIPWVHGGVLAATGSVLPIKPRETACLECLYPEGIDESSAPTTLTHGILPTIVTMTAAIQVTEGLKLIFGDTASLAGNLIQIDIWQGLHRLVPLERLQSICPACGKY